MEIRHLSELQGNGKAYVEFLRTKSLSAGVYVIPEGGLDRVVAGRARFSNGERDEVLSAGDILFVSAKDPHRFHEISERLELLVFFAPPEGTG